MHTSIHACIHASIRTCMHTYIYIYLYTLHVYHCVSIWPYIYVYIYRHPKMGIPQIIPKPWMTW